MSKTVKILVAIAALLILFIGVIQIVLQSKLKDIINTAVIPEAEKNLKVKVDIDGASINLLGGSLKLSGVRLGNPDSFTERSAFSMDQCMLNIGLLSTIGGMPQITEAHVKNAVITIVRNKENQINAKEISDSLPKPEQPEKNPEQPEQTPQNIPEPKPVETPKLLIKTLTIETMFEYIDHKLKDEVVRWALKTQVNLSNFTTVAGPDAGEATLKIDAHLDGKPDLFLTNIDGTIQPLTDPSKPSFKIDGSIVSIDLTQNGMPELCNEAGVQAESASIEVHLTCIDGVYKQPGSIITLKLKNCRPAGELLKKNPSFPTLPELSIPLPIKGTALEPDFGNIQVIIGNVLLQNLASNASVLMDFIGKKTQKHDQKIQENSKDIDEKVKKEIDRGIKTLGKFLNNQ